MQTNDHPSLLREPDVLARTGLSRSTMRRLIVAGKFPKPVRLAGTRVVAWDSRAVTVWIEEQFAGDDYAS